MPEEDIEVLRCFMSDGDEKTYYDSYFCPGTPPSPSPYAPCFEVDADNWDDAKGETNDDDEIICKPEWEPCFNDFVLESKNETLFYDCIDEIIMYKYPLGLPDPDAVNNLGWADSRRQNCTAHVGCGVHLGQYCNAETRMCELCEGCCKQRTKGLDGMCPGWCLCDHEDEADPIHNVTTCGEANSVYDKHKCCDDKNKLLDVPLDCSNVTDLKEEIASLEPALQTCKKSLYTIGAQNLAYGPADVTPDVCFEKFTWGERVGFYASPLIAYGMKADGAYIFCGMINFAFIYNAPSVDDDTGPDQETLLTDSCKAFRSREASNLVQNPFIGQKDDVAAAPDKYDDRCGVVFTRVERILEMYDTDPRARNLTRVNLDDKPGDAPITNVTLRTCGDLKRHYQNKACCGPNPQHLECSTASVTQLKEKRDDLWIQLESCKIDVRESTLYSIWAITDWEKITDTEYYNGTQFEPGSGQPFRGAWSGRGGGIDNYVILTRTLNQNGMLNEDTRIDIRDNIVDILNEYGPRYLNEDKIHESLVNRIRAVLKENGS